MSRYSIDINMAAKRACPSRYEVSEKDCTAGEKEASPGCPWTVGQDAGCLRGRVA